MLTWLCVFTKLSLFPKQEVDVDKATYDALKAFLAQMFRAGVSRENVIETVQIAWLDYQDEQKGEGGERVG